MNLKRGMAIFLSSPLFFVEPGFSSEIKSSSEGTLLEEIVVKDRDRRQRQIKKEEVTRVESLSSSALQEKKATTFAQVIDNEKGVDTQTSCAFCGAKRISINGLKGEHTTILVDGMPLHSTVSGFYGIEAIPLEGIESIDIYRGAGASLSAPESMGGAIHINTVDPFVPLKRVTLLGADDGTYSVRAGASTRRGSRSALFFGIETSNTENTDVDRNGVTESPHQKNLNGLLKSSFRLSETQEIQLKWSQGQLDVFGGNPDDLTLQGPVNMTAVSGDFENNDVRNKMIGSPDKITDNVKLRRSEISLNYQQYFSNESRLNINLGRAEQKQAALYSHGYDYDNKDEINFLGVEYQKLVQDHLLFFGSDFKQQRMNSASTVLYQQLSLTPDDFHHDMIGFFLQDTWSIDEQNELSLALRADHISVKWDQLDQQIKESLMAPRLFFKHNHNSVLTSRLGLGIGYRSPLTLFESQHGTDHNGFIVDIQRLEKAQSFVYSMQGQRQNDFFEVAAHLTNIQNMAYGIDRAEQSLPTIFTNSAEDYLISVFDFSYGRKMNENYEVEGLIELFQYPNSYKAKLPVASQEKRLSLKSTYKADTWSALQKLNLVFAQDLSSYGYDRHYNVAYTDEDILSSTYGTNFYQDQKFQKSPTFFTLDLAFQKNIHKDWDFEFEIKNIFDYTQTKAGDSPLTWAQHGNHYHLDNFHLWGPQQGRRFFISFIGEF